MDLIITLQIMVSKVPETFNYKAFFYYSCIIRLYLVDNDQNFYVTTLHSNNLHLEMRFND